MASSQKLVDGDWSRAGTTGSPRFQYPFRMNGDRVTALFDQDFWQLFATFTPQEFSIPHDVLKDFYLISETDPAQFLGDLIKFTRTYSRIPVTQNVPSSINITKPALTGSFPQVYGSFRLFQPDTTLLKYDAYSAQTVTSDSGVPTFYPTGGTYTLTYGGNTTGAINYNDSAATVQTALNALTSVTNQGGLVVAGTYNSSGGFTVTFNAYASATTDRTSLTVSGAGTPTEDIGVTNSGYSQFFQLRPLSFGNTFTGGTFTITIFGQTTGNIAYNASAATVQTALNALSEVQTNRGGVVVSIPVLQSTILSVDASGINFTIKFSNSVLTSTATSLTPAGSTITASITDSLGVIQNYHLIGSNANRTLFCLSHGLSLTDTIYIKGGSTYYAGITGTFTLPDANTILLGVSASAAYASASTITEVGKRTKQGYQPGVATMRTILVTSFYLPGITAGISSATDIPIPTDQSNPTAFLQAAFAGSGTINWQVGTMQQWKNSPIISLQKTTVLAAEV